MPALAPGVSWIDLNFRGRPCVIATPFVVDAGGVVLFDPGPTSCLETLELGLNAHGTRLADVTHILLTHVHLDHAGATGTIVRRLPHIKVFVHERGIRHLVEPSKLLESASRVFGDQMEAMWGEVAPVSDSRIMTLTGGERIEAAGRSFEVAYTPGHASHHVSFFDRSSGIAFVGDAAGIRIHGSYVRPPTPPPDIDVELWTETASRIDAWDPQTLFLTHFGPSAHVRPHLQSLIENLNDAAEWVRRSLEEPGTDEERAHRYGEYVMHEMQRHLTANQIAPHGVGLPLHMGWWGLARYWKKRGA